MKMTTLYLDTSAIGGYFDDEWQGATQELWRQMEAGRWRFATSLVTVEELEQAPERVRELFHRSFSAESLLEMTREIQELAATYVAQGVVSRKFQDDARHVASCTVHGISLFGELELQTSGQCAPGGWIQRGELVEGAPRHPYREPAGTHL